MKWKILTTEHYQDSTWSGGQTRQLYLAPPSGDYASRNFDYRLSTATVDLPESCFSDLTGFERILMTLDKPIRLVNSSQQTQIDLAPLTPYAFSGSDAIRSQGTCRDFNLIYRAPYQGQLRALSQKEPQICQADQTQFIYALTDLTLDLAGQLLDLDAGQLLVLNQEPPYKELSITLSPKQPTASFLAIWAGLQK